MSTGYQERDKDIIDYELWELAGIWRALRGPAINDLQPKNYVTCAGAAQTFGCYTDNPFPTLLADYFGMPFLNFGVAGAGPAFFTIREQFIDYINNGKLVVLQVLSGRSVSNSLFELRGNERLWRRSDGVQKGAQPMYQELLDTGDMDLILKTLEETRRNWLNENLALFELIDVPIVLVWFSTRRPEYEPGFSNAIDFFGAFPQLVDRELIEQLKPSVTNYVEYVSSEGLPQPLFNRNTGNAETITMRQDLSGRAKRLNDYYPSPEMHRGLADKLKPIIAELLDE